MVGESAGIKISIGIIKFLLGHLEKIRIFSRCPLVKLGKAARLFGCD